nr:MAG TPA: hypothetical protein [Caudoviricetes sp.]
MLPIVLPSQNEKAAFPWRPFDGIILPHVERVKTGNSKNDFANLRQRQRMQILAHMVCVVMHPCCNCLPGFEIDVSFREKRPKRAIVYLRNRAQNFGLYGGQSVNAFIDSFFQFRKPVNRRFGLIAAHYAGLYAHVPGISRRDMHHRCAHPSLRQQKRVDFLVDVIPPAKPLFCRQALSTPLLVHTAHNSASHNSL